MTPDLSEIEDIVTVGFGLFRRHHLLLVMGSKQPGRITEIKKMSLRRTLLGTYNVNSPRGEVTLLNILKETLDTIVRVRSTEFTSFGIGESLETFIGTEVPLGVDKFAFLVDELECVARVSMHMVVPIGRAAVREKNEDLVNRLWILRNIIPC